MKCKTRGVLRYNRPKKKEMINKEALEMVLNHGLSRTQLNVYKIYVFDTTKTIEVVLIWFWGKMSLIIDENNEIVKTKYYKGSLPFTEKASISIKKIVINSVIMVKEQG